MTRAGELWIFGYGSLVWRPAFPAVESRPARLRGHRRRFWQGSTDHRGVPGRPGRVVTLVADDHSDLAREAEWESGANAASRVVDPLPPQRDERAQSDDDRGCVGRAYRVAAADVPGVLALLDHRERGGYARVELELELAGSGAGGERVAGVVYVAATDNEAYLGPAPIDEMARQIALAAGPSGRNADYVFELAGALRSLGSSDAHVFALEAALTGLGLRPSSAFDGSGPAAFRR